MGIDLTPNPDNPNINGGATCTIPPSPKRQPDHVVCNTTNGMARWQYDTADGHFVMLHLPHYYKIASPDVMRDVTEWCRECAKLQAEGCTDGPPMPQSVRDFRDDPKTKAYRSAQKNGQVSLEAYT